MFENVRADTFRFAGSSLLRDVAVLTLTHRTFRPIVTLRFCHWSAGRGRLMSLLARLLHRWTQAHAAMDLPSKLTVGPGLCIVHGWGLVVSPQAKLGSNVTLFNGVVIGRKDKITGNHRKSRFPVVEDDVWIGPHAVIIGGVKIGKGAIVGPASVVTKDVPPHCVVVGNPARIVRENAEPDIFNRAPLQDQ